MTALPRGLAKVPGVRRARKLPVEVSVTFVQSPGVCETLEGPVHYDVGDAIVVGARGERWPVKREIFARTYDIDLISPLRAVFMYPNFSCLRMQCHSLWISVAI